MSSVLSLKRPKRATLEIPWRPHTQVGSKVPRERTARFPCLPYVSPPMGDMCHWLCDRRVNAPGRSPTKENRSPTLQLPLYTVEKVFHGRYMSNYVDISPWNHPTYSGMIHSGWPFCGCSWVAICLEVDVPEIPEPPK